MKYIKLFNSTAEFEAAKPSMETPYVVLDGETGEVVYANIPEISEDDLSSGAVDLGLSVKWASCNVGATSPCESGLLFQFGRTDGYAYGSALGTSFEAKDGLIETSSNPPTTSGATYDAGETLSLADDAARAYMGGNWRMPTKSEIEELVALPNEWCTCTFLGDDHSSHTVYGRKFTGNGNSIFIPAAGYFHGLNGSFNDGGSYGGVWASSVYSSYGNHAYLLRFYSGDCDLYNNYRYYGFSVRGVC